MDIESGQNDKTEKQIFNVLMIYWEVLPSITTW